MKNERITIIIPMYNSREYIIDTLKSIEDQTYKDFKVIIIDDGSTDDSFDIVDKFVNKSELKNNYSIIRSSNKGQSSARNIGIYNCTTKYFVFVDSDDTLSKDYLNVLYMNLITTNSDISIGSYSYIYDGSVKHPNSKNKMSIYNRDEFSKLFMLRKLKFVITTILFNAEYFKSNNLFFNEKTVYSEDQEFIWRLINSTSKIVYTKKTIYNYYRRSNSIMTTMNLNRILTGYESFKQLNQILCNINHKYTNRILPRWIFGVLHANSKNTDFVEFKDLANQLDYKVHFRKLITYPSVIISTTTILGLLSLKLFYTISRII